LNGIVHDPSPGQEIAKALKFGLAAPDPASGDEAGGFVVEWRSRQPLEWFPRAFEGRLEEREMFEYTGSLGEIGARLEARARAEGRGAGKAEGRAVGKAEGRVEEMAWLLREKFGPETARKAAILVPEGKFNMKGIGRMVLAFDTEESFLAAVREKFSG